MLRPVPRRALSDGVFDQLRDQIVSGALPAGSPLPAERLLCEAFAVNRSSVREALRRLEQARLVSVRHGATPRVLDYRRHAGLDLLADLLVKPSGLPDTGVIRGIVEMRSAIAPDVARLAALRGGEAARARLLPVLERMAEAQGDPVALQDLAAEYWSELVDASGNVAYRLAYNSLRASYDQSRALFTHVLAAETGDVEAHRALADAIGRGDAEDARARAHALVERGETALCAALAALDLAAARGAR
jgi:DNA-binding FadR family transcriptional regulator